MKDGLPVRSEAVEAAMGVVRRAVIRPEAWEDTIRNAIQAFLEAEGFEVERGYIEKGKRRKVLFSEKPPSHRRLVSKWVPDAP